MPKNKKVGTKKQRKEYTRYRDIINKRLRRLKAAGYENDPVYYQNTRLLKKLRDITRENELLMRIHDMKVFIYDSPSKVTDYRVEREKQISAIDFLLMVGGAQTDQQKTWVIQFRVDMNAKTAENINYVLTYPYITKARYEQRVHEIREDFVEWQRERGYIR